MMEEIWKDIKGFEGLYQVSNLGRVRSLDRIILKPHPRNTSMQMRCLYKGRVLKPGTNSNGYWYVELHDNSGNIYWNSIHRLVASTFIPNPNNLPEVNHIDENRKNNRADNLEWVTKSQNMRHGTCGARMGMKHWKAVTQMDMNGNIIKEWPCAQHASESLHIHHSQIIGVCKGKGFSAGGYRWKYKDE